MLRRVECVRCVGLEPGLYAPSALTPGKDPDTPCIADWMDPGASLEDLEKRKLLTLPGIEMQSLVHSVHGQSHYRLQRKPKKTSDTHMRTDSKLIS
jgi:hypothetical protein